MQKNKIKRRPQYISTPLILKVAYQLNKLLSPLLHFASSSAETADNSPAIAAAFFKVFIYLWRILVLFWRVRIPCDRKLKFMFTAASQTMVFYSFVVVGHDSDRLETTFFYFFLFSPDENGR